MSACKNTIYREMVLDLLHRLRLADDLFSQATEAVMSAMSLDDISGKRQAVARLRAFAKALRVIYADFLHLIEGQHVAFPPEISLWQWNEPDGEETIAHAIERLHAIAEGMEIRLDAEILKQEIRQ